MTPLDGTTRRLLDDLLVLRQQHPAWLLLAARRGPLMLAGLKELLHVNLHGIPWEDAEQRLAAVFGQFGHRHEFDVETDDPQELRALARRELREWIARRLLVERNDLLLPTDALQQAMQFADGLQQRFMTSTASRLGTVQRAIEDLDVQLNPDGARRTQHLEARIAALQAQLEGVRAGRMPALSDEQAGEGVREVYQLAMSLRADIRRVEDAYRDADRQMRQRIVSQQQHRGEVLDQLLDNHARLLTTPEGQVFEAFHDQLSQQEPLHAMQVGIRGILARPQAQQALSVQQRSDLRWLVTRLVRESRGVIEARARSERDVRSFMQTGLAAEHHRVGQLLQQVLEAAQHVDWSRQAVSRHPMPLPPLGMALAQGQYALRPLERLVFTLPGEASTDALDLNRQSADLDDMDDAFWESIDSLDERRWTEQTQAVLAQHPEGLELPALARLLPPTHDLQTLCLWLGMAMDDEAAVAGAPAGEDVLEIQARQGSWLRFHVPPIRLRHTPSVTDGPIDPAADAPALPPSDE